MYAYIYIYMDIRINDSSTNIQSFQGHTKNQAVKLIYDHPDYNFHIRLIRHVFLGRPAPLQTFPI